MLRNSVTCIVSITVASIAFAGVGDPQLKTDDPWYPGELSSSTFPRLFKTEAELYCPKTTHRCRAL